MCCFYFSAASVRLFTCFNDVHVCGQARQGQACDVFKLVCFSAFNVPIHFTKVATRQFARASRPRTVLFTIDNMNSSFATKSRRFSSAVNKPCCRCVVVSRGELRVGSLVESYETDRFFNGRRKVQLRASRESRLVLFRFFASNYSAVRQCVLVVGMRFRVCA